MPPTAKFSKEKIVEAALDIVRTEGFDALTARALGTKLGSSDFYGIFQHGRSTAVRHGSCQNAL